MAIKFYAVSCGKEIGVYTSMEEALKQTTGYPGGRVRSFPSKEFAEAFVEVFKGIPYRGKDEDLSLVQAYIENKDDKRVSDFIKTKTKEFSWKIYTDGSYFVDLSIGGYGAVLIYEDNYDTPIIISGYKKKCNITKMELKSVKVALEKLDTFRVVGDVDLFTDYKLIADVMNKKILKKWVKRGFVKRNGDKVKNKKVWKVIYKLSKKYHVKYTWINGHSGVTFNEQCDRLAKMECALSK